MGGHEVRPFSIRLQPLASQVQHVNVCPQAYVVRQVISHVVWIVIDDDVIAVPHPVGASIVIVRSGLKEESADVETLAIAAMQPPDVTGADGSGEMSVLPGMIEMIVRIAPAGFVSRPSDRSQRVRAAQVDARPGPGMSVFARDVGVDAAVVLVLEFVPERGRVAGCARRLLPVRVLHAVEVPDAVDCAALRLVPVPMLRG